MNNAIALVTGASSGIGAATAILLSKNNYNVIVNFNKNESGAKNVVSRIHEFGGKAIAVKANIGIEEEVSRLFEKIDLEHGSLTAVVNNAAVNIKYGSGLIEDMPLDVVQEVFNINLFGVFSVCKEAIRRMKVSGCGSIVNVSSESARFGGNQISHYAASKAALNTMTIALAREVARYNIRVNIVSPGIIDTEAHKHIDPESFKLMTQTIPMERLGQPEEVSEAIAWLLSSKSSYVSGSIISVAGAR